MFPFVIIPPFVLSGEEKIKQVATSSYNTAVLTNKGNVYVTGQNRVGELGVGDTSDRYNQWVLILDGISWIAARKESFLAIDKKGSLLTPNIDSTSSSAYTWQVDTIIPTNIGDISQGNISGVWSDSESVYILKKDKTLWYMGSNSKGQAGNGTTTVQNKFIRSSDDVNSIALGGSCVVIKKSDGYLWGWGSNTRSVISVSGTPLVPTKMFGPQADGTYIVDYTLAGDQAILVRYNDGKYRTKGLNIGQLPSGTASPGNTLTEVISGYTPGDGTEKLTVQSAPIRYDGTYPNWSGIFYYSTGTQGFINCGQASGYMTGVNKSSGTVDTWTSVDSSSVKISNVKGLSFGLGWVLSYNDKELVYWGSTGNTTSIPVVGYVPASTSRPSYRASHATSPLSI